MTSATLFARTAFKACTPASCNASDILTQSSLSMARLPISSRLADSINAAALFSTSSHSPSFRGALSSVPLADTMVPTDPNTVVAAGPTMPFMICFTDATGIPVGDATAGAARAARDDKAEATHEERHADDEQPMYDSHVVSLALISGLIAAPPCGASGFCSLRRP